MAKRPDVRLIGFVGGRGGASVLMAEMAPRLAARGLRVELSVPDWDGTAPFAEHCRERGMVVERTPLLRASGTRARVLAEALAFAARRRGAVAHFHVSANALPGPFLPALAALRRAGVVVTPHNPYDGDPPPGTAGARRWAGFAARRASRVVCISRRALERQLEYGVPHERLTMIHNGVDVARFAAGDGAVARARLGVGPDAPLVVVCGRLVAQKRPLDAVSAFQLVADRHPDARLVFVGEGPLAGDVAAAAGRAGLAGRVHLVGHRFDVEHWLAAATAWLLPTESEGFSLAVLEAMAAGRAIVTTRCAGNVEVLRHGVTALLTPVGVTDALGHALGRLLARPGLRHDLGAAARHAVEEYTIDGMIDRYVAVYDAALAASTAPRRSREPGPRRAAAYARGA